MRTEHGSYPAHARQKLLFASLFLFMLAGMLSGCMTPESESDWRWKDSNPNWQSPGPPEPQQWSLPFGRM